MRLSRGFLLIERFNDTLGLMSFTALVLVIAGFIRVYLIAFLSRDSYRISNDFLFCPMTFSACQYSCLFSRRIHISLLFFVEPNFNPFIRLFIPLSTFPKHHRCYRQLFREKKIEVCYYASFKYRQ